MLVDNRFNSRSIGVVCVQVRLAVYSGWRTLSGFVKLILKHTVRWSPEGIPFVSPRHGSETVGIPINKELMSRVTKKYGPSCA